MDLIFKRHYNNDVSCFRDSTSASKAQFKHHFIHFSMVDSTSLETREFYEPMLYQFYIAINAVETHF